MAYISTTEVVSRVGNDAALRLTTDSGSTIDTALIQTFIGEVEGRINSVVSTRTGVAITQAAHPNTFAALKGAAMAMTVYRLGTRRPPVPEDWKQTNAEAIEWLDKLAKGELGLPDAALVGDAMEWGGNDQNLATIRDA